MRYGLLRDLDRVLQAGISGTMSSPPPVSRLVRIVIMLGTCVGAGIGMFAIFRGVADDSMSQSRVWMQPIASALKVPALFLLTVATTLPSLYVFNMLLGPGLGMRDLTRTIFRSLVVMVTVLTSVIPIILFFSIVTSNYSFMKILVAAFATFAGLLGIRVILGELMRESKPDLPCSTPQTPGEPVVSTTAADRTLRLRSGGNLVLFFVWSSIFALVGSQMAWILRPFIGSPDADFTWFRPSGGNLFLDLFETLRGLFAG